MLQDLEHLEPGTKVMILGYGREGKSTHAFLEKHYSGLEITIADREAGVAGIDGVVGVVGIVGIAGVVGVVGDCLKNNVIFRCGEGYLENLGEFDIIIKSPGIKLPPGIVFSNTMLTSQTDLYLNEFRARVIGITGTKGKSTTTSLIYHIMKEAGQKVVLAGNIGIPPLDCADEAANGAWTVMELSSAQLEDIRKGPYIGLILNLFPEHLDRYGNEQEYFRAKMNLPRYQAANDIFIYNDDDPVLKSMIEGLNLTRNFRKFSLEHELAQGGYLAEDKIYLKHEEKVTQVIEIDSRIQLKGRHNIANIIATALCCAEMGLSMDEIASGIRSFAPLEHRLEYVGHFNGLHFYNDSIATIPEATMNAINALGDIDILILGGFDRGLDYSQLYHFLNNSPVSTIIFNGEAGKRMMEEFRENNTKGIQLCFADDYPDIFRLIRAYAHKEGICLLSPAAASYDRFRNFEERGRLYKKMAREF